MAERDVVYRMQVAAGDDVQKNLKAFDRVVAKSYTSMTKAAKASSRAQVAAQKSASSQISREIAKQGAAIDGLGTKIKKLGDEQRQSGKKSTDQLAEQVKKFSGQIEASNAGMVEGFNKSTEGVLKLGRGFAMLGIAGEDDVKKILEVMLKVQAVVDLTRGGIELYQGLTQGVKAYRAAVLAATSAETALAAARGTSAAAGIAAVPGVGGAAFGAVKGAAALAGTAAFAAPAAAIGGGLGLATLFDVGGFRSRQVAKKVESGNFDPGTFGGRLFGAGGIGGGFGPVASARRENTRRTLADRERIRSLESARFNAINFARDQATAKSTRDALITERLDQFQARGFDNRQDLAGLGRKSQGLRGQRGEVAGRDLIGGPGRDLRQLANLTTQVDISQRIVAAEQDRLRIAREIGAVSVAAGRESLSLSERQRDVARQTFAEAKNRLKTDLERFASLDSGQQGRVRAIRRKVDAGLTLNREETALAGQFGEFGEAASRSAIRRARLAGADDIFRADRAAVDAARDKAKAAEKIVIRREEDLRIRVERDESLVAKILDDVKRELMKSEQAQAKQLAAFARSTEEDLAGLRDKSARGTTGR